MAAASGRKNFLFFSGGGGRGVGDRINPKNMMISASDQTDHFELDESDVWNSNDAVLSDQHQPNKKSLTINNSSAASARGLKKPIRKSSGINVTTVVNQRTIAATSLPVNIPDWSRILGDQYQGHKRESEEDVDDDDDNDDQDDEFGRLPPHEYLARTRGSSFSVHEGIGRTLKGRDLSRVRNAVWKQTGFED